MWRAGVAGGIGGVLGGAVVALAFFISGEESSGAQRVGILYARSTGVVDASQKHDFERISDVNARQFEADDRSTLQDVQASLAQVRTRLASLEADRTSVSVLTRPQDAPQGQLAEAVVDSKARSERLEQMIDRGLGDRDSVAAIEAAFRGMQMERGFENVSIEDTACAGEVCRFAVSSSDDNELRRVSDALPAFMPSSSALEVSLEFVANGYPRLTVYSYPPNMDLTTFP